MSTLGSFSSSFSTGKQLPALQFHFTGCPRRCFCQHSTSMDQEATVTKDVLCCPRVLYGSTPSFMVLLFEASLQGTVGPQVHSSVMLWSLNLPCVQEYLFAASTYAFSSLNILPAPLVPAVVSSYFTLCTVSSSETEKKYREIARKPSQKVLK